MIDEGETDWKLICISVDDPKASQMNSIDDVDPVKLTEIYEFLRDYKKKLADDKEHENKFAFDGRPRDKEFAIKIVNETHEEWKKLITGQVPAGDIKLTTQKQEECIIL